MDGRNPAPLKKAWIDDSPANFNKQWFVAWCEKRILQPPQAFSWEQVSFLRTRKSHGYKSPCGLLSPGLLTTYLTHRNDRLKYRIHRRTMSCRGDGPFLHTTLSGAPGTAQHEAFVRNGPSCLQVLFGWFGSNTAHFPSWPIHSGSEFCSPRTNKGQLPLSGMNMF